MQGGSHILGGLFERWLGGFLDGVAAIVLFALMALTCADVISREVLNVPLPATDLTRLAMGIIVFSALPSTTLREQHICVDLFDAFTPRKVVPYRQAFIYLLCAVLLGLACWQVALRGEEAVYFNDQSEFLRVPMAPFYFYTSVMLGLATLGMLVAAIRYGRGEGALSPGHERLGPADRINVS